MKTMRKKKRWGVSAYFTVEASLVLPIVLGSIIFVICFLLFWYNRCLMEQNTAILTVGVAQMGETSREARQNQIIQWQTGYVKNKHYAWELSSIHLTVRPGSLQVGRSGQLLIGDRIWSTETACEASILNPAAFLRLCRKITLNLEEKK
ncbi:MAG: hypothetical protein IKO03_02475 [Lachnospiraceae bacterium]|nr:hypothetical protein [Lachnospiraceae bacterium]MBR3507642.1 hypothetical protein [Lachnospiraceae bacterium]MBR4607310.1 hypothetical protein [Lachnospiraceae bacterium]MBR6150447.1 hypothetical protein [Lachnospiraceae bacterium]